MVLQSADSNVIWHGIMVVLALRLPSSQLNLYGTPQAVRASYSLAESAVGMSLCCIPSQHPASPVATRELPGRLKHFQHTKCISIPTACERWGGLLFLALLPC
jgi:hypothetical protein